jgi:hypothetical protein
MNRMKKSLAVAVILLFIGIAVAPSINVTVVKASDDDFVEVTSEACGIKGFGNTTVKLTKQQYRDLEQYLVEFRAKLNETTTREEAVPIFKEAVVELNKYGLLPKGMSVEQAQRLVIEPYDNNKIMKLQDRLQINNLFTADNYSNYFCLISGETDTTTVWSPLPFVSLPFLGIGYYFLWIIHVILENTVFDELASLLAYSLFKYFILSFFFPVSLCSLMTFGQTYYSPCNPPEYCPSTGWIYTNGLNKIKTWNGSFYGNILSVDVPFETIYIGMLGFSGIKIFPNNQDLLYCSYLGSALLIKIR